ncbi:DNA-binding domain of ModE / Molybdate-binding domain of ModE [Rhodovastum atsumiense]|nr:TOBE domain-containing protein [Rhodovastum atsumiense]CAH2601708.1 DNA-binding domain of ModE / Molybdate-binding domain of ModE [Rhodovastum atsumiense]
MNPTQPTDDGSGMGLCGLDLMADQHRLAWLFRAVSAGEFLAVTAADAPAARRSVLESNNLAHETLAEWIEQGDRRGIRLTPRGRRLCVALVALRAEHARLLSHLGVAFAEDVRLLDRVAVRTSARNEFVARVASTMKGTLREDVLLEVAGRRFIKAAITQASVAALGLRPGIEVFALIKASSVFLLPTGEEEAHASHNTLAGTVSHIQRDGDTTEVTVDLGSGLTAVATGKAALAAHLSVGEPCVAAFRPSAVILGRVA